MKKEYLLISFDSMSHRTLEKEYELNRLEYFPGYISENRYFQGVGQLIPLFPIESGEYKRFKDFQTKRYLNFFANGIIRFDHNRNEKFPAVEVRFYDGKDDSVAVVDIIADYRKISGHGFGLRGNKK